MKITITRSFSKKVQLRQYEPIDIFCGATIEEDVEEAETDDMEELSKKLDLFCRSEVEKTLLQIRPSLKQTTGRSKAEKKEKGEDARDSEMIESANDI